MTGSGLPVQRAGQAVGQGRATYYRPLTNWAQRDAPVIAALTSLRATKPRWGFWKYVGWLRHTGQPWNHKRLWRVYCHLRLNLPRRTKKRLPMRLMQPMDVIPQPNVVWALDFMGDTLYGGRRFRTLNILDEGVREVLAIEVDTSLPADRVIRVLEQVTAGEASRRPFGSTMVRSFSLITLRPGVQIVGPRSGIFSLASRIRMPLWNGSIGRYDTKCSMRMSSTHSIRCGKSLPR